MKYIRTKDRIREIIEDFGGSCNVKSTYPKGRPAIDNFTVVSGVRFAPRADAVEELCDEFVWIKGDIHHCTRYSNYQELKELTLKREGLQLLGAIWTDKGLIYVAKMNDKGELELI